MLDNIFITPIEGVPIIEPEFDPIPGEILLGYRIVDDYNNLKFVKPKPKRINTVGWVSIIIGVLIFWPVSCIPCCLSCSYSKSQQPVYGIPRLYRSNSEIKEEKNSKENNK